MTKRGEGAGPTRLIAGQSEGSLQLEGAPIDPDLDGEPGQIEKKKKNTSFI